MNTIIVWLLISVSDASYNRGTLTVVGKFPDENSCKYVEQNLPHSSAIQTKCIQAKIVKEQYEKK